MTGLLLRMSIPGTDPKGGPLPDPVYGHQLAVRALPGVQPEAEISLRWIHSTHTFPDGEQQEMRRLELKSLAWNYGAPSPDLLIGARLAPPVYGLGLLEAIPESILRDLADPDDLNTDGISGRLNEVWSMEFQKKMPGRFGLKANQPTIRQQTAAAFAEDIGITSSLHPDEALSASQQSALAHLPNGGSPELSDRLLDRVVTYLQTLAVPARRNLDDPSVRRGERLFAQINCTACHIPELQTDAAHPVAEVRNQTIRPYTDLLLHDMGEALADHRPDFLASGSEWRTPPLWGLGLNKAVNGNVFFLHDGRARNLTEAILWHGGESLASREAFERLGRDERAAMIAFLESL